MDVIPAFSYTASSFIFMNFLLAVVTTILGTEVPSAECWGLICTSSRAHM